MDTIAALEKKFKNRGRLSGSELLLSHKDALDFLHECRKIELIILGIDFFRVDGDKTIPLLNSADFSNIVDQDNPIYSSYEASSNLIRDDLPGNADYATFVLKESD